MLKLGEFNGLGQHPENGVYEGFGIPEVRDSMQAYSADNRKAPTVAGAPLLGVPKDAMQLMNGLIQPRWAGISRR